MNENITSDIMTWIVLSRWIRSAPVLLTKLTSLNRGTLVDTVWISQLFELVSWGDTFIHQLTSTCRINCAFRTPEFAA